MDLNRDQLAYEWNSLPRYIYANADGQPWNFEADLAAYNCCDYQFNSPWSFYVDTNAAAQLPMDLAIEDVVAPFTLLNQAYINLVHSLGDNFFYLQATFKIDPSEFEVLAAVWSKQMEYAATLEADKAAFRTAYEAKLAEARQLAEVAAFKAGRHQVLSTNHVYSFEKRATLLDIFNDLEVTKELPLVTTRTFYKVLVDFPYVLESPTDEHTMFLFYNNTRVVLVYNGDYVAPKYEITMQTSESVEEIKRLLKIDRMTFIKEKLNITVKFYAPDHDTFDFNKYIWADIVMNNGPISSLFAIDEKQRTHRMGALVSAVWFHSRQGADKPVACTLRAINEFDAKRKKTVTKIEAKLLNCEEDDVAAFKADLGAALGYYYVYAAQIVAEYNVFLTTKIKLVKPDDRKPRLKDMEPEMFVTGYKRSCQFVPEIIDEMEVKEYEARGYQVMLYPIAGDDILSSRMNSGPQYYTCIRDPIHMYPGLRLNNLPNKDKFPYLPCCFKDDQTTKHNAAYKLYLEGHRKQARQVHDTRRGFIKTDKTLGAAQLGEPPAKLKQLFGASNTIITREGTSKSPASVLECILKQEMADLDEKSRAARLERERAKLARLPEAEFNVARQEIWNIGPDRACAILKDRAAYLDPRLFYSLLEYHYNCRLVLLDRNDFIHPLYAYIFAHFYSSARIVVVYENFGGEAEYLTIPQCETFNGLEPIVEQIYEQYISSFMLYHVDARGGVSALIVPEEEVKWDGRITAQHLNAYGQAESLDIKLAAAPDVVTYQLPFPLAPLPIATTTIIRSNVDARRIPMLPITYGATMYRIDNVMPTYKKTHSWMNDYLEMRHTSQRLLEQARYARSRGAQIYLGEPSKASSKWPSLVRAPSELVRKKLDYATMMFRKYNTAEFERYKDYIVVPNQYKTVSDFASRAGQIVAFANDTIKWSRIIPALEREPSLTAANFYIELAGKVYHCFRAERPEAVVDAHVAIFNTQTVFMVGKPPAAEPVSFLFYVTEGKIVHTYQCFIVRGN